jgi:hypothetical protein
MIQHVKYIGEMKFIELRYILILSAGFEFAVTAFERLKN